MMMVGRVRLGLYKDLCRTERAPEARMADTSAAGVEVATRLRVSRHSIRTKWRIMKSSPLGWVEQPGGQLSGRECFHHSHGAAATVLTEMCNADPERWWGDGRQLGTAQPE